MSLTIGLALDGGFVDWAGAGGRTWPRPDELSDGLLALRHATVVDAPTRDRLAGGKDAGDPPHLVVCDPGADADSGEVTGADSVRDILHACPGRAFVHVSGGPGLALLALASGAVEEIDLTIYPVANGAAWTAPSLDAEFDRIGLVGHPDGRVTATWRRRDAGAPAAFTP